MNMYEDVLNDIHYYEVAQYSELLNTVLLLAQSKQLTKEIAQAKVNQI